ncbi:MAG: hypothetical protein F4210_12190, partial [Holophagales bacterium]|nr:hypothetical protein [Holophagales bacterium]
MKLRSQLILAFLVLAVLPLAGIVGYTYVSSARAFRTAVEAESLEVTRQISVGLLRTRDDVQGYMRRLGTMLPFDDPQYADPEALVEFLWSTMGDGADFVDGLELVPAVTPERGPGAEPGRSPDGPGPRGLRGMEGRRVFWSRRGGPERLPTGGRPGERAMVEGGEVEDDEADPEWARRARDWAARVFGGPVSTPVHRDGDVVAHLEAAIRPENLMRNVLRRIPRSGGALPFALDAEGEVFTSEPEERELLEEVHCAGEEPLLDALAAGHEDLCQGM